MGIEEIKDLIYEVCQEFRNEIGEFTYCDRELTDEEVDIVLSYITWYNDKLDCKLDDKVYETKRRIVDLEQYIDTCAYGKRELYQLQNLNERLEMLESEYEEDDE